MNRRKVLVGVLIALTMLSSALVLAQLSGARWLAVRLADDPGVSWMLVSETPGYRVLRDFAEPGATRRMHHHADATWHVLTLATGKLSLIVEGEPAVELSAGQSLSLKGGVNHTFTSTGAEAATIIEVFGKAPR